MKKILVPLISAIIIGVVFGIYLFSQYESDIDPVFQNEEIIYVLQQGVYSSKENVEKYTNKLDFYITHYDDKYYRVYVAITHSKNNVKRLEEYFLGKGNDIYVRELKTDNLEFLEVLKQYDLLLQSSSGNNEMLQIEKQVLSKYEELVLRSE